MDSRKLFYFAGQCLALDERPGLRDPVAAGLSATISHETFIFFCDYHFVLPPVYRILKQHDLTRYFPPELTAHLAEIYALNQERNEGIVRQVEAINAILTPHGIAPVYLKGAAHLLDGLYADPGDRILGDIDFLVERKHYEQTARLLLESGYEVPDLYYDDVLSMKHYPRLVHRELAADVEVHQAPVDRPFSRKFDADTVFAGKKAVAGWPNCFVPADEHQIALNFIHSQLIHWGHRFKHTTLRDIYDLRLLAKRTALPQVLPYLEEKDKAEGYFLFAATALGLDRNLYSTTNNRAKRHCALSNLALKHPRINSLRRKLLKTSDVIFKRYLGRFTKAVFRRSERQHILKRIRDPRWYKEHVTGLKRYFRN